MKTISTIIKKELTEIFRDKKVIISTIVLPLVLFPLFFIGGSKAMAYFTQSELEKKHKLYIENAEAIPLLGTMFSQADFELVHDIKQNEIDSLIKEGSLSVALLLPEETESYFEQKRTIPIEFRFKSSDLMVDKKVSSILKEYNHQILEERLAALQINKEVIEPVKLIRKDIVTNKEKYGKIIGGLLPYMFILLGFMGCLYSAIDLFAGEKERKTIETLLTFPVSRIKILIGKFSVIVITGLLSIFVSFLGIFLATQITDMEAMSSIISLDAISVLDIVLVVLIIIPLLVFFAGILTPVSIYSKTYKEAMSLAGQLNIVVMIPLVVSLMPGIDLNYANAFIPILNVSLAVKEIFSGTLDYTLYIAVVVSLICLSGLSIWFCKNKFESETSLLN